MAAVAGTLGDPNAWLAAEVGSCCWGWLRRAGCCAPEAAAAGAVGGRVAPAAGGCMRPGSVSTRLPCKYTGALSRHMAAEQRAQAEASSSDCMYSKPCCKPLTAAPGNAQAASLCVQEVGACSAFWLRDVKDMSRASIAASLR